MLGSLSCLQPSWLSPRTQRWEQEPAPGNFFEVSFWLTGGCTPRAERGEMLGELTH